MTASGGESLAYASKLGVQVKMGCRRALMQVQRAIEILPQTARSATLSICSKACVNVARVVAVHLRFGLQPRLGVRLVQADSFAGTAAIEELAEQARDEIVFVFDGRFDDSQAYSLGIIQGLEETRKSVLKGYWVPITDILSGTSSCTPRASCLC
jgi:hypothetical protein